MLKKTNIHFFANILNSMVQLYRNDLFSTFAVAYFICTWMTFGNIISILYSLKIFVILTDLNRALYNQIVFNILLQFNYLIFKKIKRNTLSLTSDYSIKTEIFNLIYC